MKIVTVLGARPQFIKAAIVSRALRKTSMIEEMILHTGQHYDAQMSQVFFDELKIPAADFNLGIGSSGHGDQTGRMLIQIEKILLETKPDGVLVYGDTNSTLAGAVAAAKLGIPISHIEAGLRSFNRSMPEEINRVLTDHASDLLFTPTELASSNLRREGVPNDQIFQVGDVMYDAARWYGARADEESSILDALKVKNGCYVLATIHRAENTDSMERLSVIFDTLSRVSQSYPVVIPIHPRTRKALEQSELGNCMATLQMIEPLGYLDMIMLEKNARLVITDSGGVQKEAFFFGVPCVTVRDETEWVELVELGWNRLAPPVSVESQMSQVEAALADSPVLGGHPYGDGDAAAKIINILLRWYADKRQGVGSVLTS